MKQQPPFGFDIRLLALLMLSGISLTCKKSADTGSPQDSYFNFTVNGTAHSLPFKEGISEWSITNNSIYINRPDIFNGIINFPKDGCAYLEPVGSSVVADDNCHLTQYGLPIDSSTVYIFEKGAKSINYTNCRSGTTFDPDTGAPIPYEVCDVDGSFFLTLKNRENKTIEIVEGSFRVYDLRR